MTGSQRMRISTKNVVRAVRHRVEHDAIYRALTKRSRAMERISRAVPARLRSTHAPRVSARHQAGCIRVPRRVGRPAVRPTGGADDDDDGGDGDDDGDGPATSPAGEVAS